MYGTVGVLCWLFSYSWLPFAVWAPELGDRLWQESAFFRSLPGISEAVAFCFGIIGIILSFGAQLRAARGTPPYRLASRGLVLGILLLLLVVVPNLVGQFLGL